MSTFLSSLLSYIFTTVIYLFIISVIVLIYRDIRQLSRKKYPGRVIAKLKYSPPKTKPDNPPSSEYTLYHDPTAVGRHRSCGVCLKDKSVSNEHAEIWYDDDAKGWCIADLGSTNGTFVNGEKLDSDVYALEDGNTVMFGTVKFKFETKI